MNRSLTPLHRLWRTLPARQRRALLARASAWVAPRPDPAPPVSSGSVVIGGEVGRASGLGEGARLLHAGIAALGIDARALEAGLTVPGDVPDYDAPPTDALPAGAPLILHVNAPQMPLTLTRLGRETIARRRIVGYWTWELPLVPAAWRIGVPFVHAVWAPSRFAADAMARLLPPRLAPRVVPYPMALTPPIPAALDRRAFGLPTDAVVVLVSFNLASSFVRKNPLGAIAAFRNAFGDRPDRLLVVKVANTRHAAADFDAIQAAVAGMTNVRLETRTLPDADRHALTACADIVLSLHRSEGFGLVPAEAMLLGRAVVATGWSGTMTFMDEQSVALVGYRLVPVRDPRGVYEVAGAVWAEPDLDEAANHLRRLADDPDARAALGRTARAMAVTRLGPAALEEALTDLGVHRHAEARP